jgi:signal transduction histidine kinase
MSTITELDEMSVTGAPSFKPCARSLSHELRTPMHGVIGMLDVMHATVQESIESQHNPMVRSIFQGLKKDIEAVQGTTHSPMPAGTELIGKQIVLVEQSRLQTTSSAPMS